MTQATDLSGLIHSFENARILCVGDLMLDRFIYGKIDRISPEAPVPVLHANHETHTLGGAGNVVRNLIDLGASAHLTSLIGSDIAGQEIQNLCQQLPRLSTSLLTDLIRPTTVKTRYVVNNQQVLRVDHEVTQPISQSFLHDELWPAILSCLSNINLIIVSDYAKGLLSPELLALLMTTAQQANIPVVVDPKGSDFSKYQGATILTPNIKELSVAAGSALDDDQAIFEAAMNIIDQCQLQALLVTRGKEGMTLFEASGSIEHISAQNREVYDVSGAGDTAIATFAVALTQGATFGQAAYLANIAAGMVVEKVGTASIRVDELLAALQRETLTDWQTKILSIEDAQARMLAWRRHGLKIGFTNGCFDLLHPGHIVLLDQARSQCDRLIVGLNSDDSVSRLKGPSRPVQSEVARATVLASLKCVDLVVIFNEDTPYELIQHLRPDVLIKGKDYTINRVVGADFVQSYGGRVYLADLVPNQSTTRTIARMAG